MKKAALFTIVIAIVIAVLVFWYLFRKQTTESHEQTALPPVALSSSPMSTTSQTIAIPASEKKDEIEVKLNNISFLWLSQMHAVRAGSGTQEDTQNGFQFIDAPPQQKFGQFNREKLFVVTDKMHLERRVVTGAIVVTLTEAANSDDVARLANVKLIYESPDIQLAIYQVQDGQNFIEKLAQIKAFPRVKSASLELIGKGLQPK